MWKVILTEEYERREKKWKKKRPAEFAAVERNLLRFRQSLESGVKPAQLREGYIHPEPRGVFAVDQKGGGGNLSATRLYVWPHLASQTLVLLTIGDKRSPGR